MIYHDPNAGPAPLMIRIDAFDRAAPVLRRVGDALDALAGAFDPKRRVLEQLVPLVRAAAALDGGYRSLPKWITVPSRGFESDRWVHRMLPPRVGGSVLGDQQMGTWDLMSAAAARERIGGIPAAGTYAYRDLVREFGAAAPRTDTVVEFETVDAIICPKCVRMSCHPDDVRERYCGACHQFHRDMDPGELP